MVLNDTDGFDLESKDKDVIDYVNDCIAEVGYNLIKRF